MSDFQLKLHVEKPDTPYTNPNTGAQSTSSQGHVWYELVKPDGTSLGVAGFAPVDPKNTLLPVQGKVWDTDASAYAGDSYSTTTYKITQAQAETLLGFSRNPTAYGFSLTYWAGTNSCVDFVWKGLSTIGMNPDGNEGALLPMDNISSLSTLRNPAFADGGLVQIVRQPDTIDNRPLAPDGVSRLNDQQVIQAGPNQKILFIWTKDDNGNYQKVESIITLQSNGVWRSTAMIVGQYNSDGAPVKAIQYNFDSNGNTTSTKALVPTAGGSWVDVLAGSSGSLGFEALLNTWTTDFGGAESTTSPLVLDLNGDGVQTTRLSNSFTQGVHFNLDATDLAENTAWVDAQDGLLVRDLNGDGQISSGRELFGNHTLLHNGARAANGFEALKELDNNADGVVDANDALFASLKVWKDANSDGVTDTGELLTLSEAGVQSLKVAYANYANYGTTTTDPQGNAHLQQGNFTTTDDSTQYERRVVCSRHRAHGRHRAGNGERSHCTTAQLGQHGQPAQPAPSHGARQLGDAASTAPPTPPMRTKKAFCSVIQPSF